MSKEPRLRWSGSIAAQKECDEAAAKLKPRRKQAKAKAKPSRKRRRRKKKTSHLDYREYIASPAWKCKRAEAIKHHGSKCNICGGKSYLQVHHLTYERLGREKMTDLEVLCRFCHGLEHEDKYTPQDPLTERFMATIGG
jgi:5-methylcytosine-specific restriction endonuclease McrA